MKEKTVLLIDDSATIRRLVDSELSSAGYRVVLAATAEDGLGKARQELPDLIILDHQLPGTTGYDVCCKLLAVPETASIPIVASSTLRKKAYSEYVDCDNVVDMLPKPYTAEVLRATVENAINTAAMVVQSQSEGSAVPEVIDELGESDLAGTFSYFGLREVLDMLNNGSKCGMLEIQMDQCRVIVYLDNGRIQAVTASGIDPADVAKYMPDTLSDLAPVIKFTVSGRRGSEIDGLVELLDNKVLDPRLLRRLLRLQSAVLLRHCFTERLTSFRFDQGQIAPALFRKLPLDSSLLALLVEGAMTCEENELPAVGNDSGFVRRAIRGQNLDRAGLSSRHMQLMGKLTEPATIDQIAAGLGWPQDEVRRVLHGFELAELVEQRQIQNVIKVFAVASDPELQRRIGTLMKSAGDQCSVKLVRDWLALGLLLRRQKPDTLLVELYDDQSLAQLQNLYQDPAGCLNGVNVVSVCGHEIETPASGQCNSPVLSLNCSDQQLLAAITGATHASAEFHEDARRSPSQPFVIDPSRNATGLTTIPAGS